MYEDLNRYRTSLQFEMFLKPTQYYLSAVYFAFSYVSAMRNT